MQYLTKFGEATIQLRDELVEFWKCLDPTEIKKTNYNPKHSKMLDEIGRWFGFSREFGVGDDSVTLQDKHLQRLISTKLWGTGYDGSRESLQAGISLALGNEFQLLMQTDQTTPATVNVILVIRTTEGNWDSIDDKLFTAGYYLNPSLGIKYNLEVVDDTTMKYDVVDLYDSDKHYDKQKYNEGLI